MLGHSYFMLRKNTGRIIRIEKVYSVLLAHLHGLPGLGIHTVFTFLLVAFLLSFSEKVKKQRWVSCLWAPS